VDKKFGILLDLVDHAIGQGADHLAFTGDIVEMAGYHHHVLEELLAELDARGFGTADKLSIVPGNHDVYPITWDEREARIGARWGQDIGRETGRIISLLWSQGQDPGGVGGAWLGKKVGRLAGKLRGLRGVPRAVGKRSQADYKSLCRMLEETREGNGSSEVYTNCHYPFVKELPGQVMIVGFDTTRDDTPIPSSWAQGELDEEDIDAAVEFMRDDYAANEHLVVLMHHYPRDDFRNDDFVDLRFYKPRSAKVREWLHWMKATLVLCGHIHEDREFTVRGRCRVVSTVSHPEGTHNWGYTMVGLGATGQATVERHAWDY